MDQISQRLLDSLGHQRFAAGLETSALGLAHLLADDQPWSLPQKPGEATGSMWGWNQKKFWI